ncbi:MAG: NAD-binding protein [Thermoplasmata archaeon]|nr:NAD-binding protein [Thermoplasmata archaeon]
MSIWTTKTKLKVFAVALLLLFLFSMIGFFLIMRADGNDVNFIQALYWTVITLATLGYYPPSVALTTDMGMAFTVVVVISGVAAIFVGVPSIVAPWLEDKLRRAGKAKRAPIPFGGHVIVAGFSDTARHAIQEMNKNGFACVVIDKDKTAIEELENKGIPFIVGDGSEDQTLKAANIDTALGLVVTGKDDKNIFACLTAIKLRPNLPITAVARNPETERLLYKIGVAKVVTPKSAVGRMLAKKALGRYDADLAEGKSILGNLMMKEYTLDRENAVVGKTLIGSDLGSRTGVVVIGVWRDGDLHASPPPEFSFLQDDILIALGTGPQILALENLFAGVEGVVS